MEDELFADLDIKNESSNSKLNTYQTNKQGEDIDCTEVQIIESNPNSAIQIESNKEQETGFLDSLEELEYELFTDINTKNAQTEKSVKSDWQVLIRLMLINGISTSTAVKVVSEYVGIPKKAVYDYSLLLNL